jgi:SAM-dependent methyltransferase
MDKVAKYNKFHKKSSIQYKIIKPNNFTYKKIIDNIDQILYLLKGKNIKILDYGCGAGTLSLYLASKGYSVTGVDISPKAIELANQSAKYINISKVNFTELSKFKKNKEKYDLIIAIEVIEHVPNDTKMLLDLHMMLKKRGYLYLTTPSLNAPLYRLGLLKNFDYEVGHLRRYNAISLKTKITSTGFKIHKIYYEEGIIRNSLYTIKLLGWIVRFIKGPLVTFVMILDKTTVKIFGESNIHILSQKP